MDVFEKLVKTALLYTFCFLNVIDMAQTVAFLRMGIEGNSFVVYYPHLWFLLKFGIALGLPLGLYRLDVYLDAKEDEGFFSSMEMFVNFLYVIVLFADLFFFSLVLRNMSILGRLLP